MVVERPTRTEREAAAPPSQRRKEAHVRIATATAVVSCLFVVIASANPIIGEQVFIDFDPPNETHSIYPELFDAVDAYLVVDLLAGYREDFRSIYFRLATTPGMADQPTFTNLLPGAIVEGDWFEGMSITVDCVSAVPPVAVGKLSFVYNGIPGDVTIEPHPEYPALIVSCFDEWLAFCVNTHGGVGKEALEGDCYGSPAENASWGAIKGLYR
jgi:hypothetical protein